MTTATEAPRLHPQAEEFADFFAAGWAIGAGPRFFEHFEQRLRPDAVFEQPLLPIAHSRAQWRKQFEQMFAAIPDMRGEVVRWGPTHDGVFIEVRLHGTLGGRPVEWMSVDRIVIDEDGMLVSRKANFDPLPLMGQMARSPRAAARLLPGLLGRGGGR